MHAGSNEAWYQNGMVWLVIAIPGLTIAGCILTIYLALTHPDSLVRDDASDGPRPAELSRE
ncbi:MAG: FixH family protein [Gammaproteobacteria bacterium]|nr:FixH family protein [Gammaproteobacteria bacterium]MDH4253137.1 FixH family protein [Gammaproteobacteria bacterium]MDH5308501.1 FixH family protein [Gammaproteobacteria bacterium]